MEKVHIVGIGGVGMSALAQALLDRGVTVTGSDRLLDNGDATDTLVCLKEQGVKLYRQDGCGVDGETSRLVISSAIESNNPDLKMANRLKVPVVHRALELARIVSGHKLCTVTGTCGKSTVTAMLGHLLAETGFDPLVVNGAAVIGWSEGGTRIGSVRKGKGEWAVIEADESDKSLMVFAPDAAIITNASADHFGLDDTQQLFDDFRNKILGPVIDGRILPALKETDSSFTEAGVRFTVPMPGQHNVVNAQLAVRLAIQLGAEPQKLAEALASFRGIVRRMQLVGICKGAKVYDDYAHNPEKLAAAWRTLTKGAENGIVAVWRPHGYGPLKKMMDDLAAMFPRVCRPQDKLLLLPVYDAGGTADRRVNSDQLAERLQKSGMQVQLVKSIAEADEVMNQEAGPGKVLVTFGARDPNLPRLAKALCEHYR